MKARSMQAVGAPIWTVAALVLRVAVHVQASRLADVAHPRDQANGCFIRTNTSGRQAR